VFFRPHHFQVQVVNHLGEGWHALPSIPEKLA
jgi:hypothetical protein